MTTYLPIIVGYYSRTTACAPQGSWKGHPARAFAFIIGHPNPIMASRSGHANPTPLGGPEALMMAAAMQAEMQVEMQAEMQEELPAMLPAQPAGLVPEITEEGRGELISKLSKKLRRMNPNDYMNNVLDIIKAHIPDDEFDKVCSGADICIDLNTFPNALLWDLNRFIEQCGLETESDESDDESDDGESSASSFGGGTDNDTDFETLPGTESWEPKGKRVYFLPPLKTEVRRPLPPDGVARMRARPNLIFGPYLAREFRKLSSTTGFANEKNAILDHIKEDSEAYSYQRPEDPNFERLSFDTQVKIMLRIVYARRKHTYCKRLMAFYKANDTPKPTPGLYVAFGPLRYPPDKQPEKGDAFAYGDPLYHVTEEVWYHESLIHNTESLFLGMRDEMVQRFDMVDLPDSLREDNPLSLQDINPSQSLMDQFMSWCTDPRSTEPRLDHDTVSVFWRDHFNSRPTDAVVHAAAHFMLGWLRMRFFKIADEGLMDDDTTGVKMPKIPLPGYLLQYRTRFLINKLGTWHQRVHDILVANFFHGPLWPSFLTETDTNGDMEQLARDREEALRTLIACMYMYIVYLPFPFIGDAYEKANLPSLRDLVLDPWSKVKLCVKYTCRMYKLDQKRARRHRPDQAPCYPGSKRGREARAMKRNYRRHGMFASDREERGASDSCDSGSASSASSGDEEAGVAGPSDS